MTSAVPVFRAALIGVSGYASIYVDWLRQAAGRLRVVALAVIPSQVDHPVTREFAAWGATIYTDYQEMLRAEAGRLDLCLIPTPIHWHARMAIAALQAGANVLVEKPLAGSVADAQAIRTAEAATGRWVAVGFQDLYTSEVAWLKDEIVAGTIGEVQQVTALGIWPRGRAYYSRNDWAGRRQREGVAVLDSPLNNAFAHFVNLALFLAGPTRTTSAMVEVTEAELRRAHAIETFDTAVVRARTPAGLRLWLGFSHTADEDLNPIVEVLGSQGRMTWTLEGRCSIECDGRPALERRVPTYAETRSAMFEAVLARLADGTTRICASSVALCHTAFIEAVDRASVPIAWSPEEVTWRPDANLAEALPVVAHMRERLWAARAYDRLLRAHESPVLV